MLKALASGLIVAATAVALPASSNAMPLGRATVPADESITLVRDGCGPGARFSNRRQACVQMDRGDDVDPGTAAAIGIINVLTNTGGGHRHHDGGVPRGNFNGGSNKGGNFKTGNTPKSNPSTNQGGGKAGFAGAPNSWKKPNTGIR